MPIGVVRDAARRSSAARVVYSVVALTLTIAACSPGSPSGPGDANILSKRDGVAMGPSGLEQRLVTRVEAAPLGSPFRASVFVTSTIVNTGSAAVRLTYRSCDFIDADIETTADVARYGTLRLCATISPTINLAPGASTEPEEVGFGVRSAPGTYTLKLRQALSPEFRAETSFRVP